MALEIIWTKEADKGFESIIEYISIHFTAKEISNFVQEVESFLKLLSDRPRILQKTNKYKNVHRGPINKHTMLTYQVKPRKNEIVLLSIRSTRQKPQS
jgi:plasmid stabilization system protein ParE